MRANAVRAVAPGKVVDPDLPAAAASDVVELDERDDPDHHEDERGADRPADLQARVAVDLGGHGALARAELDQRVDERALDADEHDDADREFAYTAGAERVLEHAVRRVRPRALSHRQVARGDVRALGWRCAGCGHVKHFTRPALKEVAPPCPKCRGSEFVPQ